MPDLWMDVDVNLSEVPVNLVPLIDDTDFKTRETSVAYNASGMDLVWNFVDKAGAFTQTAVTPTTAGTYDWANQGDGMYTIEIPATGGASINNDAEGFGWFTGFATGILPWRGPIIGFRPAAINNALITGSAPLDVTVAAMDDDVLTAAAAAADFLAAVAASGVVDFTLAEILAALTGSAITLQTIYDGTTATLFGDMTYAADTRRLLISVGADQWPDGAAFPTVLFAMKAGGIDTVVGTGTWITESGPTAQVAITFTSSETAALAAAWKSNATFTVWAHASGDTTNRAVLRHGRLSIIKTAMFE